MSQVIIRFLLLIVFATAVYFLLAFGGSNRMPYPGYIGGAIGSGIVAAAALFSYVYYEVHGPGRRERNTADSSR